MLDSRMFALAFAGMLVFCLGGCEVSGPSGTPTSGGSSSGDADHDHDHADGHDHEGHDHDGHGHAEHGPRDGELIELGDEAYHAEWLLDEDAGTVTVYILDGAAAKDVPIDAEAVEVVVQLDGSSSTESLLAVRDTGAAQSARFQSDSKSLVSLLKLVGKGTEATLNVEIDGQPYTGKFVAHEHAHEH
jgi:hypothetical protein